MSFTENNTKMWLSFKRLVLDRTMAFDFRDWGSNEGPPGLPYMTLYHWAVEAGHLPLLNLLLKPSSGLSLHEYCQHEKRHGQQQMLNLSRHGHVDVLKLLIE